MNDVYVPRIVYEECSPRKPKKTIFMPHSSIHFILDGEGFVNNTKLKKGDFFSVTKDSRIIYEPDKDNPWTYIYADFHGNDTISAFMENGLGPEVTCGSFPHIDEIMNLYRFFNSYSERKPENTTFRNHAGNMILSMFRNENIRQITLPGKDAYKIKRYIDNNYYRKIKMQEIADELFMSRSHMRDIFFRTFGISPKSYMQDIRMKHATHLMETGNGKISEIARSVGYDDQLLFSKMFRSHYGVSPSQYKTMTERTEKNEF